MLRITHALKNYFASKQFKNIAEKISAFDQSVKNIFYVFLLQNFSNSNKFYPIL